MDEKVLKNAQFRKGLSIAFFNATNAAIELTKGVKYKDLEEQKKDIVDIRNWLLSEHQTYYATVIENTGANYKATDGIAKLKATKNYDELGVAWRLLSADERKDPEILKVAKEMKTKFVDQMANSDVVSGPSVLTPIVEVKAPLKVVKVVKKKTDEKA